MNASVNESVQLASVWVNRSVQLVSLLEHLSAKTWVHQSVQRWVHLLVKMLAGELVQVRHWSLSASPWQVPSHLPFLQLQPRAQQSQQESKKQPGDEWVSQR